MRTNFENLRVYKLAEQIADAIWETTLRWQNFPKNTVGAQVVRSADSIGANIAEGAGRGTYADNRRFVRNARGSLNETRHWLRRAYRRGLLAEKTIAKLKPLLDELSPKLNNYLKSIGPVAPVSEEIDN
jgi:four helix bundle protein